MNDADWVILLPLCALLLWLTLFLFTLIDHLIYRGTYGEFLLGLEAIQRRLGSGDAGRTAVRAHLQRARIGDLAVFVSAARSPRPSGRIAAERLLERIGESELMRRAADFRPRRRGQQIVALYVLARLGRNEALPLVEQAMRSSDTVLAYAALDMLDIFDSEPAAEVLLRGIETEALPASRIATQLEHFSVDLRQLYYKVLAQDTPKTRYWIAYLLGKCKYSVESEQRLGELLADQDPSVRKVALASLADIGSPQLRTRAMDMLDDPVFYVRTQACRLLGHFSDRDSIDALAARLSDPHDAVQLAAKKSLIEVGLPALSALEPLLGHESAASIDALSEVVRSIHSANSDALGAPSDSGAQAHA